MTSPAADLFLAAVRRHFGTATADDLMEAAGRVTDWNYVLPMAHIHAVTLLLHEVISGDPDLPVPEAVRAGLQERAQANRFRNLELTGELARILDRLRQDGIEAVPYKGPVLAAQAYGDVALREFVDLDILMRPADVNRARVLLQADRYRELQPLTPRRWRHTMANGHDLKMVKLDRFVVELQWAVVGRNDAPRPEIEPLLDRATAVKVAGKSMPTLAPEDLLLVLCVHGSVHLWERLAWACDVAQVLAAAPDLDLDLSASRAALVNARRVLLLGVEIARRVTGLELPERLGRAAATDPAVGALADRLVPMTLAREGQDVHHDATPAGDYLRLLLQMRDTRRDRRRQLRRALLVPTASDWLTLNLPDRAFGAYYAYRPARLAWSYLFQERRPGDVDAR